MSPASNKHGINQAKIVALLSLLMETGTVIAECSVETSEGTKVADVALGINSVYPKPTKI